MKFQSSFLCPIFCILLAACGLGGKKLQEDTLYTLILPNQSGSSPACAQKWQSLRVNLPVASSGLDNSRIAIRYATGKIEYYTGAAWADLLPGVLQQALVKKLTDTHVFNQVHNDAATTPSFLNLTTELRDFSVIDPATGQLHVSLQYSWTNAERSLIATTLVEKNCFTGAK